MNIQLKFSFDDNSIVDETMSNSLFNWCMENGKEYLLEEWDYIKNGALTPKNVSYGTDRKVWWIIHYFDKNTNKTFDLSWKASISHRKEGRNCPYLSDPIKKVLAGFNDLATTNPKLAQEWAFDKNNELGIKITDVSHGSTQKVFWICKTHGIYQAKISERVRGNGCPFCSGKAIKVGYNDLKTTNPEVAIEWDYNKNAVGPETVTKGSIKKFWWKCKNGHSWYATPNSRTGYSKTNCPICAGKQILVGFNDLASTNPDLIREWNYDKNEITPYQITKGSNKKVWWTCKQGHEFQMRVCSRTLENIGCPVCNKERKTSFLEKAVFYYIKKCFLDAKENESVSWLGKAELDIYIPSINVGIEFDGYYWHKNIEKDMKKDILCHENGVKLIRIRDDMCPKYESSAIKIIYGKNTALESLDDAIIELLNYLQKEFGTNVKFDVNVDRDYSSIMDDFVTREKENSIATQRPDLLKFWDYEKNGKIKPEFVSQYSNKIFWWVCPKCKQSYRMKVNDKTGQKHSGCPICANKRIVQGVNDLFTTNPELKTEWDYEKNTIDPYVISKGSRQKVWWKCKFGHSWQTAIYVRANMKCGCPICAHQAVDGTNSFAQLYPDLLKEWNYEKNNRDPYTVLPASNLKFWWKCSKCGHEWETALSHRTLGRRGCPYCAHQVLVKGKNDLATQFPEIAKEWNYEKNILKPDEVSGGTNKKYWWKCSKCGHEWECVVASRTKRNSKCPICRMSKKS